MIEELESQANDAIPPSNVAVPPPNAATTLALVPQSTSTMTKATTLNVAGGSSNRNDGTQSESNSCNSTVFQKLSSILCKEGTKHDIFAGSPSTRVETTTVGKYP